MARRDWKDGRLQIVKLVDCPLPPFLSQIQVVDFTEHDEAKYRQGLRELLGGLHGPNGSPEPSRAPEGIAIPDSPHRPVPSRLRSNS